MVIENKIICALCVLIIAFIAIKSVIKNNNCKKDSTFTIKKSDLANILNNTLNRDKKI